MRKNANKKELDIMAIATSIQAGGIVDQEALDAEKTFTFILKGKRTFDIRAKDEDTAMEMFKADDVFGGEKIIDVIEADDTVVVDDSFDIHSMAENRGHTAKTVTEVKPFDKKLEVAEERKSRTIIRMVMNPDGTSSEVVEEAPVKKTRAKKKS